MVASKSIVSIGELCSRWRVPLTWLERAARQLDLQPALAINGVPYFDEADSERLETEVLAIAAGQVKSLARRAGRLTRKAP